MNGLSYSKMMHGLKVANIDINRKMLAEMAVNDAAGFTALAEIAKKAIVFVLFFETKESREFFPGFFREKIQTICRKTTQAVQRTSVRVVQSDEKQQITKFALEIKNMRCYNFTI